MIVSSELPRSAAHSPRVLHGARIPMRDGITLHATVFLPRNASARVPVVVQVTPYGIDAFHGSGARFAARGLALALVDCRGRGSSEGDFEMFDEDLPDLVDTIGWLSTQEWCDGQVAMYGGSYSGTNQWIAIKARPPALRAIAPWGAAYPGIDVPSGGIPYIGHVAWHVLTSGRDTQWGAASDSRYWVDKLADLYRRHGSALELAREARITRRTFERVLRDPFHAMREMKFLPTPEELHALDLPILSATGHYDSTHPGTLHHFMQHEQHGTAAARARHQLVIGPWHHAGMDGTDQVGALRFAPQACADFGNVRLDWYRWVFGLGEKPAFLARRITYYVAGAEEWRGCDSLEEAFEGHREWFLVSTGSARDVFHSGELREQSAESPADEFVADPFDVEIIEPELGTRALPRPHKEGTTIAYPDPIRGLHFQIAGEDPTDAAFACNLRGQGVVYHSEPLAEAFDLVGVPELELWVSTDAPDTDIVALLYEILPPDGESILLWSNLMRLRYRNSWRDPEPMPIDEPACIRFLMPKFMSRRLRRGSRLRLVIRSPASIQYQKNLNSGRPVCEETPEDARRCRVRVHHEPGRQTVLRLPRARSGGT